ncbi:MAG: DUF3592 domain-containing protein [Pseudomonadota bacterium]
MASPLQTQCVRYGVFALLIALLGAAAFAYGSLESRQVRRLDAEGVEAPVRVLETDRRNGVGGRSDRFFVSFVFTTQSGRNVRGRQQVSPTLYDAARAGRRLQVVYLPDDPARHALSIGRSLARGTVWQVMGLFFIAVPALKTAWTMLSFVLTLRVRDRGEQAQATISRIAPVGREGGKQRRHRVEWTFRDQVGVERRGRSLDREEREARRWIVGPTITVFHSRRNPDRSWWIEDVGPRGG